MGKIKKIYSTICKHCLKDISYSLTRQKGDIDIAFFTCPHCGKVLEVSIKYNYHIEENVW